MKTNNAKKIIISIPYFLVMLIVLYIIIRGITSGPKIAEDDSPKNVDNNGERKIYVVGSYGKTPKACYWLNGVKTDLSMSESSASSITESNNKIYIAGYYLENAIMRACYWVNGIKIDLAGGEKIQASSIAVANDKVYVAGFNRTENAKACYWIDGVQVKLAESVYKPQIAVSDGKVYIAGWHFNKKDIASACYWVDGMRIDLSKNGVATLITISNGKVYIGGEYSDGINSYACYWIDGKVKKLPGVLREISALTVFNDKVYCAGIKIDDAAFFDIEAFYWKNGKEIDLLGGKNTLTTSIAVFADNVYVAGYYNDSSNNDVSKNKACYWKNGKKFDLAGDNSLANGIFVE